MLVRLSNNRGVALIRYANNPSVSILSPITASGFCTSYFINERMRLLGFRCPESIHGISSASLVYAFRFVLRLLDTKNTSLFRFKFSTYRFVSSGTVVSA